MLVKGGRILHSQPSAIRAPYPPPAAAPAAAVSGGSGGAGGSGGGGPVKLPRNFRECPPTGENLFKIFDAVAKKDQ
jgi:hypothetical protein